MCINGYWQHTVVGGGEPFDGLASCPGGSSNIPQHVSWEGKQNKLQPFGPLVCMPLYYTCARCTCISLVNSNTPSQNTGNPWLLLQQSLPEKKKTGDILVTSQISSTALRHLHRFIDLHVFNLFKPNRGLWKIIKLNLHFFTKIQE